MRSWIIAAALALAATPVLADTLPPPSPDTVAVHIGAAQNGGRVAAAAGDTIAVELQSNPSTGGSWLVTGKPAFLDAAGERTGPVSETGDDEVGAPVWQVFLFTAHAAGAGALTLELHGPGGQVWDSFTVTVNAQ